MSAFHDKTHMIRTKSRDECDELLDAIADDRDGYRTFATEGGEYVFADEAEIEALESQGFAVRSRAVANFLKRQTN